MLNIDEIEKRLLAGSPLTWRADVETLLAEIRRLRVIAERHERLKASMAASGVSAVWEPKGAKTKEEGMRNLMHPDDDCQPEPTGEAK